MVPSGNWDCSCTYPHSTYPLFRRLVHIYPYLLSIRKENYNRKSRRPRNFHPWTKLYQEHLKTLSHHLVSMVHKSCTLASQPLSRSSLPIRGLANTGTSKTLRAYLATPHWLRLPDHILGIYPWQLLCSPKLSWRHRCPSRHRGSKACAPNCRCSRHHVVAYYCLLMPNQASTYVSLPPAYTVDSKLVPSDIDSRPSTHLFLFSLLSCMENQIFPH